MTTSKGELLSIGIGIESKSPGGPPVSSTCSLPTPFALPLLPIAAFSDC